MITPLRFLFSWAIMIMACLGTVSAFTQTVSNPGEDLELAPTKPKIHSPHRATIYSAVLPGLGQIYNRKYWKLPLVYGALGLSAYYIQFNRQEWKSNSLAYKELLDLPSRTPEQEQQMGLLKDAKNYYRRMHEISWFALAGSYILNILDATVDAHLFHFDVSEDISFHWQPYAQPNQMGITLRLIRK